ncbi:hypothetical protein ACMHYB_00930 [Sorangium sp. So ce1128]
MPRQLAKGDLATPLDGNWHELRAEAREDRIQVFWDGSQVIDATDQTFTAPGEIGVWTKADSVMYFDDLTVVPL